MLIRFSCAFFVLFFVAVINHDCAYARKPAVEDFVVIGPEQDGAFRPSESIAGSYNFAQGAVQNESGQYSKNYQYTPFKASSLFFLTLLVFFPFAVWQLVMHQLNKEGQQSWDELDLETYNSGSYVKKQHGKSNNEKKAS